ncbi:MAG: type IV toxin-antitoxin system AbiEi family antitoxin domain-containing protein [Solirubrobacterales bacterium]
MAAAQHGVVTHRQLATLGFSRHAIAHRVASGRLHPVARGVYAVGRPHLTPHGRWMAAVLPCGPGTVLSHSSAAALMGIGLELPGTIEVSVRSAAPRPRPGLVVHRRPSLRSEGVGTFERVPTTSPAQTLIDLAVRSDRPQIERAVNDADRLDLIDPEALRTALDAHPGEPGVGRLKGLLDRRTFRFTRTELERWFLPLACDVGMPVPLTAQWVNGFEVDFFWPELRFLVETDGLRYHRTPAQQARDRLRDQTHTAAGLDHLRFTHEQIRYERDHVRRILASTFRRLQRKRGWEIRQGPEAP